MLQKLNLLSHQRLCENRRHDLYLVISFCSSAGTHVCSYPTVFQSAWATSPFKVCLKEWGLSRCWLSVCTWLAHRAGTTVTSTYSCSQWPWRADFTFSFGATPDAASSCLRLFSLQTALGSGRSRQSFCRKRCDAPLRRVVTSLPVETLQLFHVGTIRTWKEKKKGHEGSRVVPRERRRGCFGRARDKIEIVSHVYRRTCALGGRRCVENKFLCKCWAASAQPCQWNAAMSRR